MIGDDKQKRLDANDFANELAGLETGRQERFYVGALDDSADAGGRDRRVRDDTTLLQQLLQNPEYARLYRDAWSALDSAQSALLQALDDNAQAVDRLTQTVEDMENRAVTLGNEKVFRSADGNLYTADGRRLSPAEAAGVDVPDNAPSYEAYVQAREALDRAKQRGSRLAEIQTEILNPARRRLEDENDPMTEDELRALEETLKETTRDIQQSSAREFSQASAVQTAQADEPVITAAALDQIPTFTG